MGFKGVGDDKNYIAMFSCCLRFSLCSIQFVTVESTWNFVKILTRDRVSPEFLLRF